jgi:hypothetical protein
MELAGPSDIAALAPLARKIESRMHTGPELTDREVSMSHTIDDLATDNARACRVVRAQVEMLDLALHALRHGSPDVTDEYVERALEALRPLFPHGAPGAGRI